MLDIVYVGYAGSLNRSELTSTIEYLLTDEIDTK